ncbi:MFS transporter [Actinorhabdospora filicis]|uniref:MFS transporter n=1 Tax=Actinorhabdospora filicis TaxID=1785913 RepID=A0A9W6SSF7_9ACTN|nr:MFS transporter [Actinorhabdospora filicis]GLZ81447.1 MFS transporter [Actinorhabdospora filicis]
MHGTAHHPHTHPPVLHPRRHLALALLCAAQAMLVIDLTVVNVALPSIGGDLGLGREAVTWVVTGYTLAFGGLMLLGGRLADRLGRRRVLLTGLALFTLASAAAGFAEDGGVLIAGRLAQGVGAALMSPAAMSSVTTLFHGRERHRALGAWAAVGGGGAALGVLVGGLLTAGPGWQWVFIVNLPVGVLLWPLLLKALPADPPPERARLDLPGAATATLATAALVYGVVRAGDGGWRAAAVPIALAVVLYAAFALIERRTAHPLMPLRLLARRTTLTGVFLMLVATGLLISFFFLGSLYLQGERGYGPLRTGLMFLPAAVAIVAGAHLASRLLGRLGARWVAVLGFALAGAGAAWLAAGPFLPGFTLAAGALGTLFVTATATAMSAASHEDAGVTSGIVTTFHELGGSIGVAVMSTVAASGFSLAFAVCAVTAGAAALAALVIVPNRRLESSGPMAH